MYHKELCNHIPNVNCVASVTKTFTLKGVCTTLLGLEFRALCRWTRSQPLYRLVYHGSRIRNISSLLNDAVSAKLKPKLNSVAWVRERNIPTEPPPLFGEVSATFADRGCCVVSTTDPHGRILEFLDQVVSAISLMSFEMRGLFVNVRLRRIDKGVTVDSLYCCNSSCVEENRVSVCVDGRSLQYKAEAQPTLPQRLAIDHLVLESLVTELSLYRQGSRGSKGSRSRRLTCIFSLEFGVMFHSLLSEIDFAETALPVLLYSRSDKLSV
jgi:hypothetical protein